MTKLRCIMAWQNYRKGDVIEPPANRRDTLLAMRYAGRPYWEPVPEAKTEEAVAVGVTAPAPAAPPAPPVPQSEPRTKRRGRPPKTPSVAGPSSGDITQ